MALKVKNVAVWAGDIEDRSGGLADKLGALAAAGADLEFIIARRQPDRPGSGVVFVTPVEGGRVQDAARQAGLREAIDVPTLRVEGPDRPGLARRLMRAVADQGINARGFSAAVIGNKFVAFIGFDRQDDAERAASALRQVSAGTAARSGKKATKATKKPKRAAAARRR